MRQRILMAAISSVAFLFVLVNANGATTASTGHYAVSLDQVVRAVLSDHPEFAGDAIELAAPVEARESVPLLKVGPIEHSATHSGVASNTPVLARMRLHCSSDQVCLPFYVIVHLSGRETPSPAKVSVAFGAQADMRAAARDGLQHGASAHSLRANSQPPPPATENTRLRSGAHVLLVIDSGRLHLRLPVTCLENGSPGSRIRVRASGRGAVYQVEVLDEHTVRGSL